MATPLRKDEPEFENEEITTADLAQRKAPLREANVARPAVTETSIASTTEAAKSALFPEGEEQSLRLRWKEIQTAFVDEPRKAVEQADGLVAAAMKRLAEVFAEERSGLERQWDRGDNVSTEDLRVALQRYRGFFDRLLSV